MKQEGCASCQHVMDFIATAGVILRHVKKEESSIALACAYINTMRHLQPKFRQAIEDGEKKLEEDLVPSIRPDLKQGESAVSVVTKMIYEPE